MIGGDIGDSIGGAAGAIGAGGYIAGTRAHDEASGLPERMLVGVSDTTVYGFSGDGAIRTRSSSACRAMASR